MEDKKLSKKLSVLALIITGLLLTGCINAQTNIALYGNEQWSGVQAIQISAEFVEMMEQGDSVSTDGNVTTTTSVDTEGIDEWLEQARQAAERGDVNASFNEYKGDDGSLNYVMQAGGQNYDLLNEVYFQGEADISVAEGGGQRTVTINYVFSDPSADPNTQQQQLTPEEQEMQSQMLQTFGMGISFRISGGKIISSNATRVEGNTAIWDAPGEIQVTLTEAATLDPATLELVAPSADSAFSPQIFEQMMAGLTEDMTQGMDPVDMISALEENQATDESRSTTTSETTAQGDTATETTAAKTPTEGSEPQTETSAEPPATTSETLDAGNAAAQADEATTQSENEAAATPAEDDTGLPQSGGVLSTFTSVTKLAFGGLVLAVLGGAAWVNMRRKICCPRC